MLEKKLKYLLEQRRREKGEKRSNENEVREDGREREGGERGKEEREGRRRKRNTKEETD